ncbi:MAG: NAD(P)-dependent alcohol dehydrogenase [Clostridia bacterium]|nr:NAD(P)-dependent alcohol dehydrogenase [Clostridia bacterium]
MKAVFRNAGEGPDLLQIREVPTPAVRDGGILVRVRAAVVSPTDCVTPGSGNASRAARAASRILLRRDRILGEMFAGDVVETGRGARRFAVGDRVFGSAGLGLGAYAEYVALPEAAALARVPDGWDYAEAATLCDGAFTSLVFLRDCGRIAPGLRVLVNGASGALGTYAVQLAKLFGAEVTGVCGPENQELVRSLGADTVLDYTREDFTRTGAVYDIVYDTVAKSSYARCRPILAPGGIYLVTGPDPSTLLHMLMHPRRKRRAVMAATGLRSPERKARDLERLSEMAAAGRLRAVMDGRRTLEQAEEAMRHVRSGHKKGNVTLRLEGGETGFPMQPL